MMGFLDVFNWWDVASVSWKYGMRSNEPDYTATEIRAEERRRLAASSKSPT